jgi:hypothetical protein
MHRASITISAVPERFRVLLPGPRSSTRPRCAEELEARLNTRTMVAITGDGHVMVPASNDLGTRAGEELAGAKDDAGAARAIEPPFEKLACEGGCSFK